MERPALASLLPTEKEPVVLLDVGATVDCKPYNIFQFGLMGDAFARDILNKESPRVGLLSIGEEEGKGNSQVKEAYELFKMAQNLNFSGNIEGRDLFTGEMDVAVCDGFVGNVALKLSEGLGLSLSRVLKRELLNSGFLPSSAACWPSPRSDASPKWWTTPNTAEPPCSAFRTSPSSATAVPMPRPFATLPAWRPCSSRKRPTSA